MKMNEPIKSESNSTAGAYFGAVFAVCASVLLIMLTIKAGLMLFG